MNKTLLRIFVLTNFFSTFCTQPLMAQHATILTDEQLDMIHAEGLNLDFKQPLGNINELLGSNGSNEKVTPNTNNSGTIQSTQSGVQFVQIGALPLSQAPAPSTSTTNIAPANLNSSTSSLNDLTPSSIATPESLPSTHDLVKANNIDSTTGTAVHPGTANANSPVNVNAGNPQVITTPLASTNTLNTPATTSPQTQLAANNTVKPLQFDIVADPNSGVVSFNTPQSPSVEAPQTPSIGVPDLASTSTGSSFNFGGGGNNVVNVTDSSQQFLSSLVNVNAAGSIVPVVLNITINIDSTVQSLTNTNTIDIDNFNSFSFQ